MQISWTAWCWPFLWTVILASAPQPPPVPIFGFPAPNCADDFLNINESCERDTDCVQGLQCKRGLCRCRDGTVEITRFLGPFGEQPYCLPAPGYNHRCRDECAKPFVCTRGICECPKGSFFSNYVGYPTNPCLKDCSSDEFFDPEEVQCKPKCKQNEVKVGYNCWAVSRLDESCTIDEQCGGAFASCLDGRCACLAGFQKSGGQCIPQKLACPSGGEPLNLGPAGSIRLCKRRPSYRLPSDPHCAPTVLPVNGAAPIPPPVPQIYVGCYGRRQDYFEDDCPDGHFCEAYDVLSPFPQQGHCCSNPPALRCAVGDPHPTANCDRSASNTGEFCPSNTHYCLLTTYQVSGASPSGRGICCPKPCPSGIYQNGRCYRLVDLLEPCEVEGQCRVGECRNGQCQCQKNSKMVPLERHPENYHCLMQCRLDQVIVVNRCVTPPLSIGDECSLQERLCPVGSRCRRGRCQCACDYIQITNRLCIPKPVCRGRLPVFGSPLDDSDPIFCSVSGNQTKNSALFDIRSCPSGYYCSRFREDIGRCCARPDPICPDGFPPQSNEKCDPADPRSCGERENCMSYIDSPDGYVCCPVAGGPRTPSPIFLPPSLAGFVFGDQNPT